MKFYFGIALILLFAANIAAQTSKKSISKRSGAKKAVRIVEMSDLASPDVCVDPTKHSAPVDGVIVKREFDDDEITLIGVTVRETNDERYFVNIDKEYVSSKGLSFARLIIFLRFPLLETVIRANHLPFLSVPIYPLFSFAIVSSLKTTH